MTPSSNDASAPIFDDTAGISPERLEEATRGLLELTVTVLEQMDKTLGLTSLRALQSLRRRGPSLVGELANDLGMLVSTASRLSDRLSEAGLITRRVSPTNRRATELELTDGGRQALHDLVAMRTAALREVTDHMTDDDLRALVVGAHAFTTARTHLNERAAGNTPAG
jgi:DNA-binding MarR family transcriptional regulator